MKFQCILNKSDKYLQLTLQLQMMFNEKHGKDVTDDDEGVVSDYESDADMTEEMVLEKLVQLLLILQYSCSS